MRRRERAQPRARLGRRPADVAHRWAARRGRPDLACARARVRAYAFGLLVRPARLARERADGRARAPREPLLRAGVHPLAEALDAAEHRDRRRRGRRSTARRLGRGDRADHGARAAALPDRLPLDAAALLGPRAADQARLRGRAHPDAAGRARRRRDSETDRLVLARPVRGNAPPVRMAHGRRALPRGRRRARRRLPEARLAAPARDDAPARRRSSTSRSSTSPCSSSRWRSTHCCDGDGARAPQPRRLGLAAVRPLLDPVRADGRRSPSSTWRATTRRPRRDLPRPAAGRGGRPRR